MNQYAGKKWFLQRRVRGVGVRAPGPGTIHAGRISAGAKVGRRLASFLTAVALILCLLSAAACSSDLGTGTGFPDNRTVATETVAKYRNFEDATTGAGITFEKQEMEGLAASADAQCCARYTFPSGGQLTVFQYDTSNETYIKIYNRKITRLPASAFEAPGGDQNQGSGDQNQGNGDKNQGMKEYPVVAYKGVVVIAEGFKKTEEIQQLMAFISDQWHNV